MNNDIIKKLSDDLAVMLANVASGKDSRLDPAAMERVADVQWMCAVLSWADDVRTGPYMSLFDVMRAVSMSPVAKLLGFSYVCVNRDGTFAWYCDRCLLRTGDEILSAVRYVGGRWAICPLS